jgi:hypothetical protein
MIPNPFGRWEELARFYVSKDFIDAAAQHIKLFIAALQQYHLTY